MTRSAVRTGRRSVAALADSGLSSLGNLALSLVAARLLDVAEFGVVAALMVGTLLVTGCVRVVLVDPFTLQHSASDPAVQRAHATRVLGSAAVVALGVSAALLAAAVWSAGSWRAGLLGLALVAPCLVVQDTLRWLCYALRAVSGALLSTTVWTVLTAVAVGALWLAGSFAVGPALVCWGLAAGAGAIAAAVRLRLLPDLRTGTRWPVDTRATGARALGDFVLTQCVGLGGGLIISGVAGSAAYGAFRLAQLPFAPVQVAFTGGIGLLQPLMVIYVARGAARRALRTATIAAFGLLGVVAVVFLALVVTPAPVLTAILGPGFEQARGLVLPVTVGMAGSAVAAAFGPYLRAVGHLQHQVVAKAVVAPVALGLIGVGSATFGVLGGAVGQTVCLVVLAVHAVVLSVAWRRPAPVATVVPA